MKSFNIYSGFFRASCNNFLRIYDFYDRFTNHFLALHIICIFYILTNSKNIKINLVSKGRNHLTNGYFLVISLTPFSQRRVQRPIKKSSFNLTTLLQRISKNPYEPQKDINFQLLKKHYSRYRKEVNFNKTMMILTMMLKMFQLIDQMMVW